MNISISTGLSCCMPTTLTAGNISSWDKLTNEELALPVIKIGSSSGLTTGKVYSETPFVQQHEIESWFDQHMKQMTLFNQKEVRSCLATLDTYKDLLLPQMSTKTDAPDDSQTPFFLPGDSGALVYTFSNSREKSFKCVGMAVGFTSYGSCIITPIDSVLEAISCTV